MFLFQELAQVNVASDIAPHKQETPTLSEFSFKPLIMTLKQITPSSLPPTLTICGSRILFSSSFSTPKPQLSILRFYTQENVMKVALFLSSLPLFRFLSIYIHLLFSLLAILVRTLSRQLSQLPIFKTIIPFWK